MVDTSKCYALVRGRAMRVTRLDGCGAVILGPDSTAVSEGFITVALTANTDEGTAISVANAAGKICILDEPCPQFTGYTAEIAFCGVDPDLYRLMTNQPIVLDAAGVGVGFKMNSGVDACDAGFALELWSNVPAAVCEPGAGTQYGYMLVPFLRGGIIGDFTVGNDAVNFTLSGAASKDGTMWGVGPYDVMFDENAVEGPLLEALDTKDHLFVSLTSVPPPDPGCGAQELGVPATGATAGTPGSLTPTNSYPPEDFAGADDLTASPTTAWTTGQYIRLGDGTLAHWTGTAWATGVA